MDWTKDLGYQGLLVIIFLGIAVAGLLYAKKIEPVLMQPVVQVHYWNYHLPYHYPEPETLLDNKDFKNISDYQKMEIPFGILE